MPVSAVMTAAPPRISMALTMMLVKKQKKKKTCKGASDLLEGTLSMKVQTNSLLYDSLSKSGLALLIRHGDA